MKTELKPIHCMGCGGVTGFRPLEGGAASFGGLCDPPCPEALELFEKPATPHVPHHGDKVSAWMEYNAA